MVVDKYGEVKTSETKICYPIRLYKADTITTTDDGSTVLVYEANPDGYLNLFSIKPSSDPNCCGDEPEDSSIRLVTSIMSLSLLAFVSLLL